MFCAPKPSATPTMDVPAMNGREVELQLAQDQHERDDEKSERHRGLEHRADRGGALRPALGQQPGRLEEGAVLDAFLERAQDARHVADADGPHRAVDHPVEHRPDDQRDDDDADDPDRDLDQTTCCAPRRSLSACVTADVLTCHPDCARRKSPVNKRASRGCCPGHWSFGGSVSDAAERVQERMSGGALVLNATYEPLCVVPLRRAVVLVLAEKAIVVESGDDVMHSERTSIPVPTVVKLARYVRVPYRRDVPLTRRAVLDRDGHPCAYCPAQGGHDRPRPATIARRPAHLDERRGRVCAVQPPQGRPAAVRARLAAGRPAGAAAGDGGGGDGLGASRAVLAAVPRLARPGRARRLSAASRGARADRMARARRRSLHFARDRGRDRAGVRRDLRGHHRGAAPCWCSADRAMQPAQPIPPRQGLDLRAVWFTPHPDALPHTEGARLAIESRSTGSSSSTAVGGASGEW